MVITLLILATLSLFLSVVLMTASSARTITIISSLVVFMGMIGLLIANDNYHFGLKKVSTTSTQTLVSSTPNQHAGQPNILLYQPLGNGQEKIYLYRTNASQTKPQATPSQHTTVKVRAISATSNATLMTKTTRWRYQNGWTQMLFGLSGEGGQLVSRQDVFQVPNSWLTLSTSQAKQLAKLMKDPAKQDALQAIVAQKMAAALKRQPQISANDRLLLEQQLTKSAIEQQVK
ncbi:DUF4811 domain-containing protein [Furfurilactobacillus curtus]|uniref:DUF4811 domain-containing protein n=1 Tax=Furfurilactobacillus curtus TaxID=1746200 RepID=A0ABQ5JRY1_9LACO